MPRPSDSLLPFLTDRVKVQSKPDVASRTWADVAGLERMPCQITYENSFTITTTTGTQNAVTGARVMHPYEVPGYGRVMLTKLHRLLPLEDGADPDPVRTDRYGNPVYLWLVVNGPTPPTVGEFALPSCLCDVQDAT